MYPNVYAELKRKNITHRLLAVKMHISHETISSKLNGKDMITFQEAVQIKRIIDSDIPLEILFSQKAH